MYSDRWSPGLRQGDVLVEIPFPLLPRRTVQWQGSGGLTLSGVQIQQPTVAASAETVIVLSHDCEFNEGKRTHFLVARVDGLRSQISEKELEELRVGNDVEAASAAGAPVALDTFILDPLPTVFERPHRVNFATVTSVPMAFTSDAVRQKRAELTHDARVLFRRKASVFFGRDADDIPDEQKHPAPTFGEAADAGDEPA